jgi:hypothetical protein
MRAYFKGLTSDKLRAVLREQGIHVDEPMSGAQKGELAHRAKAALREQLEAPENPEILTETPPATPEPEAQCAKTTLSLPLIDRFPPLLATLPIDDARALYFEFLETQTTEIPSLYTSRAGVEACLAHRAQIRALQGEFMALAGFEKRELKEALQAKWRESVKGAA